MKTNMAYDHEDRIFDGAMTTLPNGTNVIWGSAIERQIHCFAAATTSPVTGMIAQLPSVSGSS